MTEWFFLYPYLRFSMNVIFVSAWDAFYSMRLLKYYYCYAWRVVATEKKVAFIMWLFSYYKNIFFKKCKRKQTQKNSTWKRLNGLNLLGKNVMKVLLVDCFLWILFSDLIIGKVLANYILCKKKCCDLLDPFFSVLYQDQLNALHLAPLAVYFLLQDNSYDIRIRLQRIVRAFWT